MMRRDRIAQWLRPGLLALLLLTAALLWCAEGQQRQPSSASPAPSPNSDMRKTRESAYEKDLAALEALVQNTAADDATREMAAEKLSELITRHQNENVLETALREAGYDHAVVVVLNKAVTVMIPQERLTDEACVQILSLCTSHTDAGAENVRIMALTDEN